MLSLPVACTFTRGGAQRNGVTVPIACTGSEYTTVCRYERVLHAAECVYVARAARLYSGGRDSYTV